jgi:hypothetical protein
MLIEAMQTNIAAGKHCGSCSGVCCTFVANSMQTTPLETWEIYVYLRDHRRLNAALRDQLLANIKRYRLDVQPPGDGRRSFMRRTYTCPFFMNGPLGCSLPPEVKPYGCLGFNPRSAGLTEGGDCASDQELLEARDQAFAVDEAERNQALTQHYGLDWEKRPMPWALLTLWDAIDATGELW